MRLRSSPQIAIAFVGALIVVHLAFGIRLFEVNDDVTLISLVKGLQGLSAQPDAVFLSPFVSRILYHVWPWVPTVPLYSMMLYAGLAISAFTAAMALLRQVSGIAAICGLLVLGVLFSLVGMQINFAAISLLLGITAVAWLTAIPDSEQTPRDAMTRLAALQLPAAYLLRPSMMFLLIAFALPLLWRIWQRRSWPFARLTLGPLIILLIVNAGFDQLGTNSTNDDRYRDYNKVRSDFNDSNRSSPTPETPAALAKVGWDWGDYAMGQHWWLHDEKLYGTDKLNAFLIANAGADAFFDPSMMQQSLVTHQALLAMLGMWLGVIILLYRAPTSRANLVLFALSTLVVITLMGLRFPPRIAMPCLVMLCLYAAPCWRDATVRPLRPRTRLGIIAAMVAVTAAALLLRIAPLQQTLRLAHIAQTCLEKSANTVSELARPGAFTIDLAPHLLPVHVLPFEECSPALTAPVLAGGWLIESDAYRNQLHRLGLGTRATAVNAMIDHPLAILRCWDTATYGFDTLARRSFLKHLRRHYSTPQRVVDLEVLRTVPADAEHRLVFFRIVTKPAPAAE